MKQMERLDVKNDFRGLLLFQRTEFLAKKLTYPLLSPNTQEGLCQTELLQALLDVKLHIMRVSEVLCEPDTFRKPEGSSRNTVSVLPYLIFHKIALEVNLRKVLRQKTE